MFFRFNLMAVVLLGATALSGLTSVSAQTNSQRDAVIGGAAGAIIGGIVGNQNDETPEGIAIGGVAGAIAGHVIGKVKDNNIQDQYHYQQQQQQAARQYQHQQAVQLQKAVSIQDAISLSNSGVSPQLIINQIHRSGVQQEIGVSEVIVLHQNGVSELVINEMQKASVGGPETVYAPQSTVYVEPTPVIKPVLAPVVVARPVARPTVVIQHGSYRNTPSRSRGYYPSHRPPSRAAKGHGYYKYR